MDNCASWFVGGVITRDDQELVEMIEAVETGETAKAVSLAGSATVVIFCFC